MGRPHAAEGGEDDYMPPHPLRRIDFLGSGRAGYGHCSAAKNGRYLHGTSKSSSVAPCCP